MRTLTVALLLSVPLAAGDEPSLKKAVGLFRSPSPATREAGSQLADRELRRLLAPLLEAMEDRDPEVRRRARRSILSLVPGEVEKEARDAKPQTRARAEFQALLRRRGLNVQRQALKAQQQAVAHAFERLQKRQADLARKLRLEAELTKKVNRLLAGLGLHGAPLRIERPRGAAHTARLGLCTTGLLVRRVRKDSPAARLGLRWGDLILRINGEDIAGMRDVSKALRDKPDWSRVTVTVLRNGRDVLRLPKE
jgi:C-terminal processing protease CtpA/Prc